MKARILLRKLGFLAKLLSSDNGIGSQVFRTLSSNDVYEISIVQQCRSLEQHLGTNHLGECLANAAFAIREATSDILKKTGTLQSKKLRPTPLLPWIVCATGFIAASWKSTWNEALKHGVRGTRLSHDQTLFNSLFIHLVDN